MEFVTTDLLWSLLTIIFIDLILAGDNAIVIGMAARQLPAEQQKKAIFWGTAGAISIRLISSLIVVWLLQIPALMMTGGVLLICIAYKLLTDKKDHNTIASHTSLSAAVRTIVIADGVMGIDNVMAVAGVAHGDLVLVATGILITIPLIIWGSTAFIRIVDRYPIVVYAGGAILAWTAGGMIAGDSLIAKYVPLLTQLKWIFSLTIVAAVLGAAILSKRHTVNAQSHIDNDQTIRGEHQA